MKKESVKCEWNLHTGLCNCLSEVTSLTATAILQDGAAREVERDVFKFGRLIS